jgi:hypothetical protein
MTSRLNAAIATFKAARKQGTLLPPEAAPITVAIDAAQAALHDPDLKVSSDGSNVYADEKYVTPSDVAMLENEIERAREVALTPDLTEQQAQKAGIEYKVGRFPFTASGKATAAGDRDGFVKLIFDADEKLIGAHLVGATVTEMLGEPTLAKRLGVTAHAIAKTIHSHPTMHEGLMEASEAALGAAIHL